MWHLGIWFRDYYGVSGLMILMDSLWFCGILWYLFILCLFIFVWLLLFFSFCYSMGYAKEAIRAFTAPPPWLWGSAMSWASLKPNGSGCAQHWEVPVTPHRGCPPLPNMLCVNTNLNTNVDKKYFPICLTNDKVYNTRPSSIFMCMKIQVSHLYSGPVCIVRSFFDA